MSECPGYTLEAFLAWQCSVTVQGMADSNFSIAVAEIMGNVPTRPDLTQEQFAQLVTLYEPHREKVENLIDQFDDETMSWRSYGSIIEDYLPPELGNKTMTLLEQFKSENATH